MSNLAMTIKVEAPDLVAALTRLAAAICSDPSILTPDTLRPPLSVPVPATPTAAAAPVPPVFPVAPQTPIAAPAQAASPISDPAPVAPPVAASVAPAAPPAPAPAPTMPVAGAPTYTLDQIANAGAALMDTGKTEPLLALLTKYGVQAVTQLQPAQYGVFATELRALGAQI